MRGGSCSGWNGEFEDSRRLQKSCKLVKVMADAKSSHHPKFWIMDLIFIFAWVNETMEFSGGLAPGTKSYGGTHYKRSLFCDFALWLWGKEKSLVGVKGQWRGDETNGGRKMDSSVCLKVTAFYLVSGQLMATQPRPNFLKMHSFAKLYSTITRMEEILRFKFLSSRYYYFPVCMHSIASFFLLCLWSGHIIIIFRSIFGSADKQE